MCRSLATILLLFACIACGGDPPETRQAQTAPAPAAPAPASAPTAAAAPAPAHDPLVAADAPALVAADAPAAPAAGSGEGPLVQAEAGGVGTVVDAAGAEGGRAVTSPRPWEPLLRMPPPPAELGGRVELWVRHRGGPLQAKGVGPDGAQQELAWTWARPAAWTWTCLATVEAGAVRGGAVVIRGKDGEAPLVDAARWRAGPGAEPPTPLPPQPIVVRIDWDRRIAVAGDWSYGMNLFRGYDAAIAGDPRYHAGLRAMSPGLLRWWSAEMDSPGKPAAWLDHDTRTWRRETIAATLRAHPPGLGEVMLTIGHFPPWMDADRDQLIDETAIPAWAELCADLVRIVNVECGAGVRWWEITNERDDQFHNKPVRAGRPSRMDLLVRAYRAAAIAMKAVDPTIRTGGPAAIRPDLLDGLRLFVRGAADQLDFYSYHAYASGAAADADGRIFGRRVSAIRDAITANARMLREEIPGREVPTLLGEFNISWTWQTRDPRMADHKGAVFDALVLAVAATAGATGVTAWNEMDGIYGKMDAAFRLRPSAALYGLLNRHGRGAVVASEPAVLDEGNPVVAYAVVGAAGRMLMLVNRANRAARIDLAGSGMAGTAAASIAADGQRELRLAAAAELPAHSVTVAWSTTAP